jgi:Mrp family chromosome partitioning ATPase
VRLRAGRAGAIAAMSAPRSDQRAINLAITLDDTDLRRPSVALHMGLDGDVGLTTVLIGQAAVADVIEPWGDSGLHVLASGQIPPTPPSC